MDLEKIYGPSANAEAADLLMDTVDDLFLVGDFTQVDEILTQIDLSRLNTLMLVGLLSVTLPAKELLRNRAGIRSQAETLLLKRETPERVKALLRGL